MRRSRRRSLAWWTLLHVARELLFGPRRHVCAECSRTWRGPRVEPALSYCLACAGRALDEFRLVFERYESEIDAWAREVALRRDAVPA